jgi:serine protease Do
MNETDYGKKSDWYSASAAKPAKKNHTALIVILICAFVVIVVGAILFLIFGARTASSNKSTDSGELPYSWRDYLDSVYDNEPVQAADIELPETDYTGKFSMSLTPEGDAELSLQEIYSKCLPSIVSLTAYAADDSGTSWGTGVVLSSDGLIITNTHVIDGCDSVTVTLSDGTEYSDAKLVGADSQSDITILKIDASNLTPAEFGDSSQLEVGDSVAAIGNPLGENFTDTMTNGIISAINRDVTYNGHTMTLMQTNAAINEGNSGGPLVDMYGHVIGITNMKMMSSYSSIEGIGFAIPSSGIATVAGELISGGTVTGRPSIGITVGPVTESVSKHYDIPNGLYISAVSKGSDAEKQGVKAGDILTAVNGKTVSATKDVSDIKDSSKVGDTLKLTIWRDGKTFDVDVKLVESSDIY